MSFLSCLTLSLSLLMTHKPVNNEPVDILLRTFLSQRHRGASLHDRDILLFIDNRFFSIFLSSWKLSMRINKTKGKEYALKPSWNVIGSIAFNSNKKGRLFSLRYNRKLQAWAPLNSFSFFYLLFSFQSVLSPWT